MDYCFRKDVNCGFAEAIERATAKLKEKGFGILTEIDVQSTLKNKIGVDFPAYRILGACNPKLAHRALLAEPGIGTMLPCNVVVRERSPGVVEVLAVDPVASMAAVQNPDLGGVALEVRGLLRAVVEEL